MLLSMQWIVVSELPTWEIEPYSVERLTDRLTKEDAEKVADSSASLLLYLTGPVHVTVGVD